MGRGGLIGVIGDGEEGWGGGMIGVIEDEEGGRVSDKRGRGGQEWEGGRGGG